jgi:hypothetical protein
MSVGRVPHTPTYLIVAALTRDHDATPFEDHENDVLCALRVGTLRAHGLRDGRGALVPILSDYWLDKRLWWDERGQPYSSPCDYSRAAPESYTRNSQMLCTSSESGGDFLFVFP